MVDVQKALQTQLANIEKRSGKTIAQLHALLKKSKLQKHGELVGLLKEQLGLGHGDANAVAHTFRAGSATALPAPAVGDALAAIYAGKKADLRPLHDAVMARIAKFGAFEIAPKKTYLSLRRDRQFAMVGPGTKGRLEIGINHKQLAATDRLLAQPAGGMCQFKVFVSTADEIDAELLGWLRSAFDAAGA